MTVVLGELQLDDAAFRGQVLGPADGGYDEHRRIWNGSFDRRPAATSGS